MCYKLKQWRFDYCWVIDSQYNIHVYANKYWSLFIVMFALVVMVQVFVKCYRVRGHLVRVLFECVAQDLQGVTVLLLFMRLTI